MTDYGFNNDEEFIAPKLPKKKQNNLPKEIVAEAVEEGASLGFVKRGGGVTSKTRRDINREPQGKILVTGPERIMDRLRETSIKHNLPYWRVIELLLDKELP